LRMVPCPNARWLTFLMDIWLAFPGAGIGVRRINAEFRDALAAMPPRDVETFSMCCIVIFRINCRAACRQVYMCWKATAST